MQLLKKRKKNRVDRRMALESVPMIRKGVGLETAADGNKRVTMTLKRGSGFFERMRPPETKRSYDLDEFGSFVIEQIDGERNVLELINAFQKRFQMSRREVELSVVAFVKLLMQRNVLVVAVAQNAPSARSMAVVAALLGTLFLSLAPGGHARAQATSPAVPEEVSLLPGSPGNLALEADIARQFNASGFESGEICFRAPVLEPGTLVLTGGGERFELDALHPTLMRPGNFAEDRFETRLVYLGAGDVADLARVKGIDLKDTIAVMDFECGDKWLDLLRFGIKGFAFVGRSESSHAESVAKVYNSEVAVPRFYIDGDAGERLRALVMENATLPAEAVAEPTRWKRATLRDLWVLIPGSDVEHGEKIVAFSAPIDANSVVPAKAYGAQRGVNLQILLGLLEDFKKHPPLHSVLLVAVNAHTQLYAGERQLAWQLIGEEERVEVMRDVISSEMRLARLHAEEYGRLHLDPIPEAARDSLHVMIEVLWQLDAIQSEARREVYEDALAARAAKLDAAEERSREEALELMIKLPMPERDEVLDLSGFTAADLEMAIDNAEETLLDAYSGFFAKRGRDADELEKEKQQDLALLKELRALSYDAFMARAKRVKHAFDDEKLFEKWRATQDKSTGERVYVKAKLQDKIKGLVNRTMQEILVTKNTNRVQMAESKREARLAELAGRRDTLRKILVLFNKLDIGVGRTRTRYRQIAVNDVQREILKASVDEFVEQYTEWEALFDRTLSLDRKGGRIRTAVGSRKVALAIALELDGHESRYGFSWNVFRTWSGWFNGFGAICLDVAQTLAAEQGAPAGTGAYVDALSKSKALPSSHFFADPGSGIYYFHAAQKTPAFALKSAFGNMGRVFGPDDSRRHLDADRVAALQADVRRYLVRLVENEKLVARDSVSEVHARSDSWSVLFRTYNLEQFTGKPIPTRPVPGSLVALYPVPPPRQTAPCIIGGDVANCYMAITDESASTVFYGLGERRRLAPTAYLMDSDFREVLFTIDKGRVQSSKQIDSNLSRTTRATVPLFACREFVIKDRRDPSLVSAKPITINKIWPKEAQGQSNPQKYGVHGADCLSPAKSQISTGPIGVYLYRQRSELDQDALMVITHDKRCALNSTPEHPEGIGFEDAEALGDDLLWRAANDMALLNASRSAEMQGVVNELLDDLRTRGEALNAEARVLREQHDHLGYLKKLYEAFGNHVKAYNEIGKMNADMLKAVVAYMALMLPFCFFLQKLLFNFKKLEHELVGFTALFVSMFALFRFVHPAFRMAMSPEAIFIAFVLGAIGVFTTGVLRGRFNEQMLLLFRGVGGIGEDVGYGTVGTTAMMIGVQNMRRRRVRTTLTTATIVLVVFTMLAFSSVSKKAKPTLIAKTDTAPYTGLLYHWPGGTTMDEASYRGIRDLFADRATIRVRRLMKRDEGWRMALVGDRETSLNVTAITGVMPDDTVLRDSMALVEGQQFETGDEQEVIMTMSAADALGLGADDVGNVHLHFLGRDWLLRGLLDDQRYRLARDLNPNLPLVPWETIPKAERGSDEEGSLDLAVANVTDSLMETSGLVLIPEAVAAELGASPRSVSVRFGRMQDAMALGQELRRALEVTEARFYVGSQQAFRVDEDANVDVKPGVYYVGSSYRTQLNGLTKLIIPLIIAGSIILNTMLGTVYERKSEIAVFNAIGLNPTHIFMFFLAEALVYSFIGAVGGYLIGQILTIGLKSAGIIKEMNINFSSMMVVYAVLFTMALVVLSTLYPGYVATRTAVPSGKRKWSMPDHDGQQMKLVFPFIYKAHLAYGVMFYLEQFFAPLTDQSRSDMVAELLTVKESKDADNRPVLSLTYNLALAPFDLGVTQNVTFIAQFDDVVQSFRLHMEIERVSGRDTNWVTTNKPFMERMRKYLIRWRNIDPTRQSWFVAKARTLFKDGVPPAVESER